MDPKVIKEGQAKLRRLLATNTRRVRKARGFTLKQAGQRAEMHWRLWQKIEAGVTNATMFTLTRVADALDMDPADLLREPPEMVLRP